jgi:hypothetical protein
MLQKQPQEPDHPDSLGLSVPMNVKMQLEHYNGITLVGQSPRPSEIH